MSWKGFKKAVERLPHTIMAKSGNAEESVDEEYDVIQARFREVDGLTSKLHDAARKYRDAMTAMLKHQQSFAGTMVECYRPITGRQFLPQAESSAAAAAPNDGVRESPFSRKPRPQTPEKSLLFAEKFYEASVNAAQTIIPELEVFIERRVVKPAEDMTALFKIVYKTMTKRDHKKIDFDRHSDTYKKMKDKGVKDAEDERKMLKQQATVESAFREYEKYNGMLKAQLPVCIALRIPFSDPVLESLICFQLKMFSTLIDAYRPLLAFMDNYVAMDIMSAYNAQIVLVRPKLEEIKLLRHALGLAAQPATEEPESSWDTDDTSNPSVTSPPPYSTSSTTSPPQIVSPPSHQLTRSPSTTNPFYPPAKPNPTPTNPFYPSATPAAKSTGPPPVASKPLHLSSPKPALIPPKPSFPSSASSASLSTVPKKLMAVALYDYDPQQAGDLALRRGQRVEVLDRTADVNGWWRGRVGAEEGVFPGNYVQME